MKKSTKVEIPQKEIMEAFEKKRLPMKHYFGFVEGYKASVEAQFEYDHGQPSKAVIV